jgi:integrase
LSRKAPIREGLFDDIPGYEPGNHRVHLRREVTPDELARILTAALNSTATIRNLTGRDRFNLYLVAFSTGYRASELASLHPIHFELDADTPAVVLPGKKTKNSKRARQPLPPGVVHRLREYLADKSAGEPVWPGSWNLHAAKMLREDLAAAGVPYRVEGIHGPEYADFHALRHTFCSAIAALGAGPKELQELARHSDPRLTIGLYTHARPAELARMVSRLQLPAVAGGEVNPLAALSREQLEGAVVWLIAALGTLIAPQS